MSVRVQLLTVGHATHFAALVGLPMRGVVRFPALVAVIRHPTAGVILFDAGYGSRVVGGRGLVLAAYRTLLPVRLDGADRIDRQLARLDIDPGEIALVILSHAHPDHIGGLADLPPCPVLWSRATQAALSEPSTLRRLREITFRALVPDRCWPSATLLEDRPAVDLGSLLPGFSIGFDVLGDGSLIGVPLPGHARGQLGLLCRLEGDRLLFLVADAAWIAANVTKSVDPHRLLDRLAYDRTAYRETLSTLRALHHARPDIVIIPSHCAASAEAWCRA